MLLAKFSGVLQATLVAQQKLWVGAATSPLRRVGGSTPRTRRATFFAFGCLSTVAGRRRSTLLTKTNVIIAVVDNIDVVVVDVGVVRNVVDVVVVVVDIDVIVVIVVIGVVVIYVVAVAVDVIAVVETTAFVIAVKVCADVCLVAANIAATCNNRSETASVANTQTDRVG